MPERTPEIRAMMVEVGERMKNARTSLRLTQTQVGELADDPNLGRRMTMYEKGEDHMNMVSYFKICKALGVSPSDLAPSGMFPANASFTREFLGLPEEQRKAVMIMIETLEQANEGKAGESVRKDNQDAEKAGKPQ